LPVRALVAAALLVACSDDGQPGTWYGDVGATVRTKCAGCHRPDGIAPFSLYEYADALEVMERMVDAVDRGIMPPFAANDTSDCKPRYRWRDDPRLTSDERASLHAWVEAGGPAGDVRELPEPPSTTLAGANVELAPAQAFASGGNRDQFVCFLFDPQIKEKRWLTGSQVFPTASAFVHHVNVDLVPPADAEATIAAMGGIGVPHLPCDNPPGVPIQSWLPGNPALELPGGVGIPVEPGTLVAIQVHYHPAGGAADDATSIALRLTDDEPDWRYELGVYGNAMGPPVLQPDRDDPPDSQPVFIVPANIADHTETMVMVHKPDRPLNLRVLSVTPHMHYLGTHERATVRHADGTNECLVDSGWDFDWQRTYTYDAPLDKLPKFEAGSTVTVSCSWDNTFANPNLPRLLYNSGYVAPYDVRLGLTTADEMCLADFGFVTPN
jgi:mono/diheme cytochrome c family protein